MVHPMPSRASTECPEADRDAIREDVYAGRLWTTKQVADMLHCSTDFVLKLCKRDPCVLRVGIEYRIPDVVFRRWLDQMQATG